MNTNQLVDLYRNHLLLGFYQKRGKSISVPHVLYAIHRFHQNFPERPIRVLDIGCGKGDLLNLIWSATAGTDLFRFIKIQGIDIDAHFIEEARQRLPEGKFTQMDLTKPSLSHLGDFDIIVSINTLHEVFSSKLKQLKGDTPRSKRFMDNLFREIAGLLSPDGTFILYDGLDTSNGSQPVEFKIRTKELKQAFTLFLKEYAPTSIHGQIKNGVYSMAWADFVKFISTFKYLNSPLWDIVSQEVYGYFNDEEFKHSFRKAGLIIDSLVLSNNDLGLWKHHVELVDKNHQFPFKSILLAGTKRYLPSQYDIFVENV